MAETNYDHVAEFYDLFAGRDDLEFFAGLAQDSPESCLELGVGTGRVALELAKQGSTVVGIDTSRDMLRVAGEKLAREPQGVRERLLLLRADMREFYLAQRFGFVYSPGGSFQECLTEDEMMKCLRSVRPHLIPEGRLALALWMPSLDREYGIPRFESPRAYGDGKSVERSIIWHRAGEGGFPSIDICYRVFDGELLTDEYSVSSVVNSIEPSVLRRVLSGAGFEIEREFGGFDGRSYREGEEWMVMVARLRF